MEPNLSKSDFLNEDGHGHTQRQVNNAYDALYWIEAFPKRIHQMLLDAKKEYGLSVNVNELMAYIQDNLDDSFSADIRQLEEAAPYEVRSVDWMNHTRPVPTNPATTEQVKVIEANLLQVMGRK
jgi:hypothetical protein